MDLVILSSALIIGLSGGDGNSLQRLEHQIEWAEDNKQNTLTPVKQNTLTPVKPAYLSVKLDDDTNNSNDINAIPQKQPGKPGSPDLSDKSGTPGSGAANKNNIKNTVKFKINESFMDTKKINLSNLSNNKIISLIGYASPDGEAPKMQQQLANDRAVFVKNYLSEHGFKSEIKSVRLCKKCWKVELYQ
ncbi:MAG: hypothetical protein LBH05_03210 [Deferribacteraceae bacterium]|jgi:outer membrane protein OmpA-like peptidoglycan-associated protein|nr:hypothetical protein [Deferribacteraceae bacterium]